MNLNFTRQLILPKVLLKEILKYVDSATIYHLRAINKYLNKLVAMEYSEYNNNNFLKLIVWSDNLSLLKLYSKFLVEKLDIRRYKTSCIIHGSIKCLNFFHRMDPGWDHHVWKYSCKSTSLKCLKFLSNHGQRFVIRPLLCKNAFQYGNLEFLKFARRNRCGCEWCERIVSGSNIC